MKLHSPACERNKNPIAKVLKTYFPKKGHILEIASGTGQHAECFCSLHTEWVWQPSDQDSEYLNSIKAHQKESQLKNFEPPLKLSCLDKAWPIGTFDGAYCANMIHISPWEATLGLFRNTSNHLKNNAFLITYGPYEFADRPLSESNQAFNASLKQRNPSWGIRHISDIEKAAEVNFMQLEACVPLPAHNHCLIFRYKSESLSGKTKNSTTVGVAP